MIILDSSAVIAVLLDEPERLRFSDIISATTDLRMSAVNVHEASCVLLARRGSPGIDRLWRFIAEFRVVIVSFDESQARLATEAYARYGKGLGSAAQLNLCDCAAYALRAASSKEGIFRGRTWRAACRFVRMAAAGAVLSTTMHGDQLC